MYLQYLFDCLPTETFSAFKLELSCLHHRDYASFRRKERDVCDCATI